MRCLTKQHCCLSWRWFYPCKNQCSMFSIEDCKWTTMKYAACQLASSCLPLPFHIIISSYEVSKDRKNSKKISVFRVTVFGKGLVLALIKLPSCMFSRYNSSLYRCCRCKRNVQHTFMWDNLSLDFHFYIYLIQCNLSTESNYFKYTLHRFFINWDINYRQCSAFCSSPVGNLCVAWQPSHYRGY